MEKVNYINKKIQKHIDINVLSYFLLDFLYFKWYNHQKELRFMVDLEENKRKLINIENRTNNIGDSLWLT